jgi:uncharacterized protein (TIGR02466 family)
MVFVPITPELSTAFGTPISIRMVTAADKINAGLEAAILKRRESDKGNRISNVGGWQSRPDLLDWPEPAVKLLKEEVDHSVQLVSGLPAFIASRGKETPNRVSYKAYGWANVNEAGNYNVLHMHPGNQWSVVYYVRTGAPNPDAPMSGRLELRDPRPGAQFARMPGFTCGQPLLITPAPGLMVVFPAWIEHGVHPYAGEGLRISVAINVTLEGS